MYYFDDEKRNPEEATTTPTVHQTEAEVVEEANPAQSTEERAEAEVIQGAQDQEGINGKEDANDIMKGDQSPDTYSSVSLAANRRKFIVIGVVAAAIAMLSLDLQPS